MALSPTLSDPCDGNLVLTDRNGVPIMLPEDYVPFCMGDFSVSRLLEDQPAATPKQYLVKK